MAGIESGRTSLSAERQEKFAELLDLMNSISERTDSNITGDFIEFMNENDLKFEDYFLANVFSSIISHSELPEKSDYKFYDTNDENIEEDGKIESFIKSLALVETAK